MNISPALELSIYRLALGVQPSVTKLSLTPATLLSLLRSQIDLLIEQQIAATLWVKLPPGKIWHSEIQRYHHRLGRSAVIYHSQAGEVGRVGVEAQKTSPSSASQKGLQSPHHSQTGREYFLMVLSPQFCSLIVVYRPLKNRKKLLAITTVEGKVIQQVLSGLPQATVAELLSKVSADLIYLNAPEPALMSQLLTKQLQRQEEMNRQIMVKQIKRVERQKQALHNTLQFKDEFFTSVCQELRTPLTHMKTALSLLNSPHLKNPQRQRYQQMVNTQCDRQNSLINGVVELMQTERNLEETSLELIRLADVVPGVVSTYQPLAQEKGIMLGYTVPTELPPVWCVSGGLRQIVIHLLSNSIKFTLHGGQVWVRGRVHGGYVQLEFRDTGIGIPESEIPKIFDRFYRVRLFGSEDPGGAGLGLTIVQQLLESCGGSISVKSKLSEGSTFIVQLASVIDTNHHT